MMKRSQRGAAKVSVVWAICLFMAFAAAAVAYFLASQEMAAQRELAERNDAARKKAEEALVAEQTYVRDITKLAGFSDPNGPVRMEAKELDAGLKALKEGFPTIDATVTNIQKAIPIVVDAYKAEQRKATEANSRADQLAAENGTIRGNVDQVRQQMEKDVADLRRQLSDAEAGFNDQKAELERSKAELAQRVQEENTAKLAGLTEIEKLKRQMGLETDAWRGRMSEAERKLTPFTKEPEAADGRILSISPELKLGWINVGSKQRLSKGLRFRIVDGQHGSKKVKGWAEVTNVENDMAEVTFSEQADPFDPPVVGDVVYNPLYDPKGERSAVLIGRFSGGLTEESLKALLKSMNITVTKGLERTTDFLIVGGEQYTDPETGQPLETPVQPSDLPVYKEAQAEGVQIVPLKELRQYFRGTS